MSGFAYLFERFPSLTQTFCYREVLEMIRQGMDPMIFSVRRPDKPLKDVPAELSERVHYLPGDGELTESIKKLRHERAIPRPMNKTLQEWTGKTDKHRVYAAAYIGPLLKKEGIRHVHAHFAGIAARTACWLKRFYGISFSFTGHANDIFVETDYPVTLADLMREARFVATETDFSRDWLIEKFPQHAARTFRVYNGIVIPDEPDPAPENALPRILSVGRYIEKKGFPVLIDACANLRDRKVPFRCDIVGGGPMESSLSDQVSRLGLGESVFLPGSMPQSDVREYVRNCDVFSLPCVLEGDGGMDNLPTVIVEAMAHGRPVVSTPIAGVPEMVQDGRTGFLVPEHDPQAVADAMEKLLSDRELRQRLGQQGYAVAREKFATQTTTRSLKHLLVRHGRARVVPTARAADPELKWLALRRLVRL